MNTSIYIAKRYLFSRKKMHAINIISGVSMAGVLVGSAALVIILSVYNGFEKVILSLYSNFTPEIRIVPRYGKTFSPDTPYFINLHRDAAIFSFTQVLEEKALIRYGGNKQFIGTVAGVSDDFLKNTRLDSSIVEGSFMLKHDGKMFAVAGTTVQNTLSININDRFTPLQIYSPRRQSVNTGNPMDEFVVRSIYPVGIFTVQQDFDDRVITPIEFMRDLLDKPGQVSSLNITYKSGTDLAAVQKKLEHDIGKNYIIQNRNQQNVTLYKTLNYERWSIFLILVFVLIIAIFNIIGSLTMLVIEKKKDIAVLSSLGAGKPLIQGIFFFEGMMIAAIGCITGMLLGLIFCILQQQFGLIKMGGRLTILDAYPVQLRFFDFVLVLLTVTGISVIASGISARLSVKGLDDIKQDL